MPLYVGDTDAKAREEFEEHFWHFQRNLIPGLTLAPPGYTSVKSALRVYRALQDGKTFINSCESWDDVERGGFAVVGSAQTVAQKLIEWSKRIGCGNLLGLFQLGHMPREKAFANMRRYAESVKPLIDRELPNAKEPMPSASPSSSSSTRWESGSTRSRSPTSSPSTAGFRSASRRSSSTIPTVRRRR